MTIDNSTGNPSQDKDIRSTKSYGIDQYCYENARINLLFAHELLDTVCSICEDRISCKECPKCHELMKALSETLNMVIGCVGQVSQHMRPENINEIGRG